MLALVGLTNCSSLKQLWDLQGILVSVDGQIYAGGSSVVVMDMGDSVKKFTFNATSNPVDNGWPVKVYTSRSYVANVMKSSTDSTSYTINAVRSGWTEVVASCSIYSHTFIVYVSDKANGITVEKLISDREEELARITAEKESGERHEGGSTGSGGGTTTGTSGTSGTTGTSTGTSGAGTSTGTSGTTVADGTDLRQSMTGLWADKSNPDSGIYIESSGTVYLAHPSPRTQKWVYGGMNIASVSKSGDIVSQLGNMDYVNKKIFHVYETQADKISCVYEKSSNSATKAVYLTSADKPSITCNKTGTSGEKVVVKFSSKSVDEEVMFTLEQGTSTVYYGSGNQAEILLSSGANKLTLSAYGVRSKVSVKSDLVTINATDDIVKIGSGSVIDLTVSSPVVQVGNAVTIKASVAGVTENVSYQWYKGDGTKITGATSGEYVFTPQNAGSYSYYVTATGASSGKTIKSTAVKIEAVNAKVYVSDKTVVKAFVSASSIKSTVNSIPSNEVNNGFVFESEVDKLDEDVSYQWYVDGSSVSYGRSAKFEYTSSKVGIVKVYLEVTGKVSGKKATSNVLPVQFVEHPSKYIDSINQSPIAAVSRQRIAADETNVTVTFSVQTNIFANLDETVSYKWYDNSTGREVSSTTNSAGTINYTRPDTLARDTVVSYYCIITGNTSKKQLKSTVASCTVEASEARRSLAGLWGHADDPSVAWYITQDGTVYEAFASAKSIKNIAYVYKDELFGSFDRLGKFTPSKSGTQVLVYNPSNKNLSLDSAGVKSSNGNTARVLKKLNVANVNKASLLDGKHSVTISASTTNIEVEKSKAAQVAKIVSTVPAVDESVTYSWYVDGVKVENNSPIYNFASAKIGAQKIKLVVKGQYSNVQLTSNEITITVHE